MFDFIFLFTQTATEKIIKDDVSFTREIEAAGGRLLIRSFKLGF